MEGTRAKTKWERDLAAHHNMFWNSVLDFHLGPLLDKSYQHPTRKKIILDWLKGASVKRVLIRQLDFYCDPLLLEFGKDGWKATVLDDGSVPEAEVELRANHLSMVAESDSLRAFLFGLVRGEFKIPLLCKKFRDHYYAMKIFLGGNND